MCGRYSITTPEEAMRRLFNYGGPPRNLPPRYNVAPTQDVPVVRPVNGGRELVMLRWGLIPFWAKDMDIGYRTINARAETVVEKPSFREAFKRRRCLIPASGFYEWRKRNGAKQPYNVAMKDSSPFALAGLWERWDKGEEGPIESCTIIVTNANELLRPIHDRMPVILDPADYAAWLDTEGTVPQDVKSLLRPYPPNAMTAYPVSKRVNTPKNDDPACLEPIATG